MKLVKNLTKKVYDVALSSSVVTAATVLSTNAAFAIADPNINPGTGFADDIGVLINAVLSFVMVIAALLVFLYLIWGGIEWITSGGDKGKTENARNKITAAVIGLIILAASYAILRLALSFLGFDEGLDQVFTETKDITGN